MTEDHDGDETPTPIDRRLARALEALAEAYPPRGRGETVLAELRRGSVAPASDATQPPRRSWLVSVAAAIAVLLAVGVLVIRSDDGSDVGSTGTTQGSGPGSSLGTTVGTGRSDTGPGLGSPAVPAWAAALGPGWHDLPAPPFEIASGTIPALSVNDRTVMVAVATLDGTSFRVRAAALDATLGVWHELPSARASDSSRFGLVTSGPDTVLWTDTAVYRYDARRVVDDWARTMPTPKALLATKRGGSHGGPVGEPSGVLFWSDGLRYHTADDTWSTITPPPLVPARASAAWASETSLIVHGLDHEDSPLQSPGGGPTDVTYVYDATIDRWGISPGPGLTGFATDLVSVLGGVVGIDYGSRGRRYDAVSGAWSDLPPLPFAFGETTPILHSVGQYLVVQHPFGLAVLDRSGQWTTVPRRSAWMAAGDGIAVAWGDALRVWVPPASLPDGRFTMPSELMVMQWRLVLPAGFTAVSMRGGVVRGSGVPEIRGQVVELVVDAPGERCTVSRGHDGANVFDAGPSWMTDPATTHLPVALDPAVEADVTALTRHERAPVQEHADAHVAFTFELSPQRPDIDVTCDSLAAARRLADSLTYVSFRQAERGGTG